MTRAELDRLIREHEPLARALARKYVRPDLPMDDALQEARLAMARAAIDEWDPARGPFGALAHYRITSALLFISARMRTRRGHASLDVPPPDASLSRHELVPGDAPSPEEEVTRREEIALVRSALASMPEDERTVLLACIDGTQHDLAARIGVPRSTMARRHSRALASLAERLGTTPAPKQSRRSRELTYRGETRTAAEWGRLFGVERNTWNTRLKRAGWDVARALEKTSPVPAVAGLAA